MKSRFGTLDVRCCAADLRQRCVGMRLVNVYDVNAKTYILKFARTDEKVFVLVESGIRMHTTEFFRDKNNIPSGFAMKLRKHIRTRRLMDVRQLGYDRVIMLDFTGAEGGYYLFVEFYASGNIILTDHQYSIMSLLRVVQPNEETRIAVHETYDTSQAKGNPTVVTDEVLRALISDPACANEPLKKVINQHLEHGQALTEHALLLAGLQHSTIVGAVDVESDQYRALLLALQDIDSLVRRAETQSLPGYVFGHQPGTTESTGQTLIFEDFWPFIPKQLEHKQHLSFSTFDRAVDEYFSRIESQKVDVRAAQQEAQALKKINSIRSDHQKRVEALAEAQFTNVEKAQLIEGNLQRVEDAILVVRSMLAQGMSWKELQELVHEEKSKGNPVALIINRLKLEANQITLLLSEQAEPEYDDSDESDSERPPVQPPQKHLVDIDLDLSAYSNARLYYDLKRSNAIKQEKTIAASEKAMKNAERKVTQEMKQVKVVSSVTRLRKPFWFEKFLWFISSENYVVVAGRDMQQNELLVKRYLKKGDLYVHADIHGASSVIIKNPSGNPVLPSTLSQAGTMAVCQSSSWDSKVVLAAYWVEHHQVSKTAPSGEYLTTGSFMIRGKKNYLPPVTLVLGFGILFKVDETSIANHLNERRARAEAEHKSEADNSTSSKDGADEVDLTENGDVDIDEEEPGAEATLPDEEGEEEMEDHAEDQQAAASGTTSLAVSSNGSSSTPGIDSAHKPSITETEIEYPDTDAQPAVLAALASKSDGSLRRSSTPLSNERLLPNKKLPNAFDKSEHGPGRTLSNPKPQNQAPRGKRTKLKKIKEKYADQDEEDRALAMALLAPVKKQAVAKPKGGNEKGPLRTQGSANKDKGKAKASADDNHMGESSTVEVPANDDEELQKALDDESLAKAEREELRRVMAEEKITLLEAEELSQLSEIDSLTGSPFAHDVLLFAVPVCAPYNALNGFKFRIKLTPGTQRKGKAAKMAVTQFLRAAEATSREKDLIKAVPDTELTLQMKASVKLSAPNLEKTKAHSRATK